MHGNPEEHIEKQEIDRMLKQGIHEILKDREEWAIFKLLLKSYDRNEIGEMLEIPVERIDSKIHYGKKKIQQYIQRHFR